MKETETKKLIDRKELIRRHPALGARKGRLDWLIRSRQIPMVRISARQIFFDEIAITNWIEKGVVEIANGK